MESLKRLREDEFEQLSKIVKRSREGRDDLNESNLGEVLSECAQAFSADTRGLLSSDLILSTPHFSCMRESALSIVKDIYDFCCSGASNVESFMTQAVSFTNEVESMLDKLSAFPSHFPPVKNVIEQLMKSQKDLDFHVHRLLAHPPASGSTITYSEMVSSGDPSKYNDLLSRLVKEIKVFKQAEKAAILGAPTIDPMLTLRQAQAMYEDPVNSAYAVDPLWLKAGEAGSNLKQALQDVCLDIGGQDVIQLYFDMMDQD